jgi:hypothetical protein
LPRSHVERRGSLSQARRLMTARWIGDQRAIILPARFGPGSRSWAGAVRERPWASRRFPQPGFGRPVLARPSASACPRQPAEAGSPAVRVSA